MTDRGEEESYETLVAHRPQAGLLVKLDQGFTQGVYNIVVEYDELADRVGFTVARRQALDYAVVLKERMAHAEGYSLKSLEDASQHGAPGRKRDLESTFLSFAVASDNGSWHDAAMKEQFRVALLRADQEWDQHQARTDKRRQDGRRERFRQRLDALLAGEAYRKMDGAMKERLLAEVTALAFPVRDRER
jgi:hypothetical protein